MSQQARLSVLRIAAPGDYQAEEWRHHEKLQQEDSVVIISCKQAGQFNIPERKRSV